MTETNTMIADLPDRGDQDLISHYVIELGEDTYALPQAGEAALAWVQRPQEPTYLPTLPPWCLGLVNLRNMPVLLIDLRMLLGIAPSAERATSDAARHVFVERGGQTLGFLVDATRRFRMLPAIPLPPDGEHVAAVQRIDDLTVGVLNLESIWRRVLRELGTPDGHAVVA